MGHKRYNHIVCLVALAAYFFVTTGVHIFHQCPHLHQHKTAASRSIRTSKDLKVNRSITERTKVPLSPECPICKFLLTSQHHNHIPQFSTIPFGTAKEALPCYDLILPRYFIGIQIPPRAPPFYSS